MRSLDGCFYRWHLLLDSNANNNAKLIGFIPGCNHGSLQRSVKILQ